jgi:hypothetical protein
MNEGIANKIRALKSAANGFRNTDNFKTAIYFQRGGIDLYLDSTHGNPGGARLLAVRLP